MCLCRYLIIKIKQCLGQRILFQWYNKYEETIKPRRVKCSTCITFLHTSTRRLPVPGCTHTHGKYVKSLRRAHQRAYESNPRLVVRSETCGRIHSQETGWRSGVRSCIMPGLLTHLVQELNIDTVSRISSREHPSE